MTLTHGSITDPAGTPHMAEGGMPTGAIPGTVLITHGMLRAGTGIGTGTGDGTGTTVRTGAGTILSMILGGDTHTGPDTIQDTGPDIGQGIILGTGQDIILVIIPGMDLEQDQTTTGTFIMGRGTAHLLTGRTEGAMLQPPTEMLQEGLIQEA